MSYRIGKGYDVHQIKVGEPLILGGVSIPYEKGVVAHSDGDILLHAIIDSLLGALALGDIGALFPNSKEWENISGLLMLKKVKAFITSKYRITIINIDSSLIAEKPKILTHADAMKKNIAQALGLEMDQIGIKATTNERMGFVGKGEGMAAMAVASVEV